MRQANTHSGVVMPVKVEEEEVFVLHFTFLTVKRNIAKTIFLKNLSFRNFMLVGNKFIPQCIY
jgi:hypothetical protein